MRFPHPCLNVPIPVTALIVLLWLLAPPVHANHDGEHRWIDPNGGAWVDPFNWDPAALPFEDDTARFELVDETYTVDFGFLGNPLDVQTFLLFISEGDVTFDLNDSTYTVGPSSIIIGQGSHTTGTPFGIVVPNTASLTVEDGLMVANTVVLGLSRIGLLNQPNVGTLNVRGGSSNLRLTDGGSLIVGSRGTGFLNVGPRGVVRKQFSDDELTVLIGRFEEGVGTVNVDGGGLPTGTAFLQFRHPDTTVHVGDEGQGTLNVTNRGTASAGTIHVAARSGSTGDVLVDTDGRLRFDLMVVGGRGTTNGGTGTLTLTDGGDTGGLNDPSGTLRILDNGMVTLDGGVLHLETLENSNPANFDWQAGRLWLDGMDLPVGTGQVLGDTLTLPDTHALTLDNAGLTIQSNGTVNLTGGRISTDRLQRDPGGLFNWSSGELTVREMDVVIEPGGPLGADRTLGADSRLLVFDSVFIGDTAAGALMLTDGATGETFSQTTLGSAMGSDGTLAIEGHDNGAPSEWLTDGLVIAEAGTGTVMLSGGAQLRSETLSMGVEADAIGQATAEGDGTLWEVIAANQADMIVGGAGDATIHIRGGARLRLEMTNAVLGEQSGGRGVVNVSGAGSELGSDQRPVLLGVGEEAHGELSISGGGVATFRKASVISEGTKATGVVNVDGTDAEGNASLFKPQFLDMANGEDGMAELNITAGGRVETGEMFTAAMAGSRAEILVEGAGSELIVSGGTPDINLADDGEAFLDVTRGGRVEVGGLSLGNNSGSGHVTVSGSQSRIATDEIVAGFTGVGTFDISDGGVVTTGTSVFVAEQSTAEGVIGLDGTGSRFEVMDNVYLGGISDAPGGMATMTVGNGATFDVGQTLRVWDQGEVNLAGGTLSTDTVDDTHGGTFNFTGGRLEFNQFQGTLNNQGGTLAPGTSPGIASVSGNYIQTADAALEIEIAGDDNADPMSPQFDALEVGEIAVLDGLLQVLLLDGFEPTLGTEFDVLTTGSVRSGEFATVLAPVFGGLTLEPVYHAQGVTLEVVEVTIIPGDADGDGDVDGFDLGIWQTQFGMTGEGLSADFDMDGDVDGFDLGIWQIHFGTGLASVSGADGSTVPEPATAALLIALSVGAACCRRGRSFSVGR